MKSHYNDLATLAYHLGTISVKGVDSIPLALCIQIVDNLLKEIDKEDTNETKNWNTTDKPETK